MLSDVITDTRTVDEVVAVLRALDSRLADDDGLKWFNVLYIGVTEAIRDDAPLWQDWQSLERFNVMFAQLYFDAIVAWDRNPALAPPAWRPLFAARRDAKLTRVQFAFAGMNAHINRDLPVALERMAALDGSFPSRDSARYRDFLRINDVLERTEAALRPVLSTGLVRHVDSALGDYDSLLASWKVRKAREAGWTNGEVCWHLRGTPFLQGEFIARLDQMVAFAGRGLLVPRVAGLSESYR